MRIPHRCSVRFALLFVLTIGLAACGGSGGSTTPTPPPPQPSGGGSINSVNHVIIMFQENRSFDDYFGQMTAFRQKNNIPIVSSDGKINDLSTGNFSNQNFSTGQVFPSYHSGSVCTEDLTPDWSESHKMMDAQNPLAAGPGAPMNGFVQQAFGIGQFAISIGQTFDDTTGHRAMGFYDDTDLNYYYFMGANFAIGDAFYSPVPTRTTVNRLYIHAATSQGFVHNPTTQLTAKTIWQDLDAAGITWKIYFTDIGPGNFKTYLSFFTFFNSPTVQSHIVPISEYLSDVQNGTLPAVSFIETGMFTGRDEHPTNFNPAHPNQPGGVDVQVGAKYVESLVNALMQSPSWKDSVFFLTFDEGGALFDHVPPISVPSPDGIKPGPDLLPKDSSIAGADFTITGFRIPNIVISPFAKKNFVSHTGMDYTAYLKFIETRWKLPALTARDAAMPDMTEFFDFVNVPWATPPSPPAQNTNGVCDFTKE